MSSRPKKNQGRRKVNMEKIENQSNLQVTFSKRRAGVFKKTSEICTLTGAEAGLVVFSPSNKPHSFGHPDINTIASRFMAQNSLSAHVQQSSIPVRTQDDEYLALLEKQLEFEKARRKELKKRFPPVDLDKLNYQQLSALREKILEFAKNFEAQAKEAATNPPLMSNDVGAASGMAHDSDDVVIPYNGGATSIDDYYVSPPAQ